METTNGFEIDFLPQGTGADGGDAIVIRFGKLKATPPEQKVIVIDGGYKASAASLVNLIKNTYKTNVVDLVILTHPDQDHASGLRVLFEDTELKIKKLVMHRPWLNDKINTSYFKDKKKTEKSLNKHLEEAFYFAFDLSVLAEEKIGESNISEPKVGSKYLDDTLTILGPTFELYKDSLINSDKTPPAKDEYIKESQQTFSTDESEYEDYKAGDKITWYDEETTNWINETSVICLFEYEGNKILLTGDAGKKGLNNAFAYAKEKGISLKDLKIFQVPHHGSRKNLDPALLDAFNSSFCIISCPPKGDPNHPSRRLINLMIQKGKSVYTNSNGMINWGINKPERNWKSSEAKTVFPKIEK
jgi:beta-lactamase superfamily II metal-dependent hydrolase